MNHRIALFVLLIAVSIFPRPAQSGEGIDDTEARLTLARALSWQENKEAEALVHYRDLMKIRPQDPDILREAAGLLLRLNDATEAEALLLRAQQIKPDMPELLIDLAALAVHRGHAMRARSLFKQAGAEAGTKEDRLRFADAMQLWGDFYRSERIYRELLSEDGENSGILLRLAKVLEAMQRYEEAESLSLVLLRREATRIEALKGLVRIKQKEKDFEAAARFEKQLPESEREAVSPSLPVKADSIDTMHARVTFLVETGESRDAIALCRDILRKDEAYFPARIDLALLLAENRQFDEAIRLLDKLAFEFESPSRIILERARVLSWSRRYEESIAQYDALHALNPDDPVPLREKARVAAWAKEMDLAQLTYRKLLVPPVDTLLLARLETLCGKDSTAAPVLEEAIDRLRENMQQESGWREYEKFAGIWADLAAALSPTDKEAVQQTLDDLHGKYLLQRNIESEAQSKLLSWEKRYAKALDSYQGTVMIHPGNQEALFDLGQTACALGLNDIAKESYQRLLKLSPRHTEARSALEAQERYLRPQITAGVFYWEEEGRGELSGIRRIRESLNAEIPFLGSQKFNLSLHRWQDDPTGTGDTEDANGFSAEWEGVLSPWIALDAGWTHKDYEGGKCDDLNFGHAGMALNIHDRLHIGLRYERREEITNAFALQKGIYSDNGILSLKVPLTRRWNASFEATASEYSDHNESSRLYADTGYILSEHPRELKLALFGEYRDTGHENSYRYAGKTLLDIEHPYWTPEKYTMGGASLEWRHDLSRFQFREAEQHYYSLRVAGGNDSDNNAFVQFNAAWHVEFKNRWTVDLGGFLHRSREWDANGAHASMGFRF